MLQGMMGKQKAKERLRTSHLVQNHGYGTVPHVQVVKQSEVVEPWHLFMQRKPTIQEEEEYGLTPSTVSLEGRSIQECELMGGRSPVGVCIDPPISCEEGCEEEALAENDEDSILRTIYRMFGPQSVTACAINTALVSVTSIALFRFIRYAQAPDRL
eukprot:TRINITY_DN11392_c0_g1_i1.p1 TRINITY_DN11392_c0_g1~~TRINITY_DN11392_c0_g1_i1.p1  ORF type:complete len:171 (+),score=52.59 TRINITY_DN11392_c0_g1_i1:45-515(+)